MFNINGDEVTKWIGNLNLEQLSKLRTYQQLRLKQFKRNIKQLEKIFGEEANYTGAEKQIQITLKQIEVRMEEVTATDKVRGE